MEANAAEEACGLRRGQMAVVVVVLAVVVMVMVVLAVVVVVAVSDVGLEALGKVMRRQAIREQDLVSSRRSTGPCSCARSSVAVGRGGPVRLMRLRPVE